MSTLSSSKTSGCSSIYIKKDTSRFSVYNNYYCHNTGRSFEPIFRKFTWLVASPHMGQAFLFFFFLTIGPIEPLIWGKMCPQNWFFGFHSAWRGTALVRDALQTTAITPKISPGSRRVQNETTSRKNSEFFIF